MITKYISRIIYYCKSYRLEGKWHGVLNNLATIFRLKK